MASSIVFHVGGCRWRNFCHDTPNQPRRTRACVPYVSYADDYPTDDDSIRAKSTDPTKFVCSTPAHLNIKSPESEIRNLKTDKVSAVNVRMRMTSIQIPPAAKSMCEVIFFTLIHLSSPARCNLLLRMPESQSVRSPSRYSKTSVASLTLEEATAATLVSRDESNSHSFRGNSDEKIQDRNLHALLQERNRQV